MKTCPAVIAALPREARALVKGWELHTLPGRVAVYIERRSCGRVRGHGCGAGGTLQCRRRERMPVTVLFSVGLAGACDPALRVGDIVRAGVVIDGRTGERFENSSVRRGTGDHRHDCQCE